MRRALIVALVALFALRGVATAAPATTFAALTVNGVATDDVLVALDAPGVAVERDTLHRLIPDLVEPATASFALAGHTFVRLAALTNRVRYDWDERALRLDLTVATAGTQRLDLSNARPTVALDHTASAHLDYDVLATDGFGLRGALAANANAGAYSLRAAVASTPGLQLTAATFAFDDPLRERHAEAGLTTTLGDALAPSRALLGFATRHDDGISPLVSDRAAPSFSGIAAAPSVADLYVNGRFVRSVPVAPGAFTLGGIPADARQGTVDIVVHDADGVVRRFSTPYAVDDALVRAGSTRDALAAGRTADGAFLVDALVRHGVSDRLTLGMHVSSGAGRPFAAVDATAVVLPFTLHLALAAHGSRAFGYDAALEAPLRGGTVSLDILERASAPDDPAQTLGAIRRRVTAAFSRRLSAAVDATVSLDATAEAAGRSRSVDAGVRVRAGRSGFATLAFQQTRSDATAARTALVASFTTPLGAGRSMTASSARGGAGIDVQQSPAGRFGLSDDVHAGPRDVRALVVDQTPHATVRAGFERIDGRTATNAGASGSLAFAGGAVAATAPIEDGFALVRVPGIAGAPITVDQQPAGVTDARGNLFVTGLHRFTPARIAIAADQLPLDVAIDRASVDVAPAAHGAAVAVFDAHTVRTVTGRIRDLAGTRLPAYARLELERGGVRTVAHLDDDERFAIDDLAPGSYRLLVTAAGVRCAALVQIPQARGPRTDVGTVACSRRVAVSP